MAAHLGLSQWQTENTAAQSRIKELESSLASQRRQIQAADERNLASPLATRAADERVRVAHLAIRAPAARVDTLREMIFPGWI